MSKIFNDMELTDVGISETGEVAIGFANLYDRELQCVFKNLSKNTCADIAQFYGKRFRITFELIEADDSWQDTRADDSIADKPL